MIEQIEAVRAYFLPVQTRVPLKFGTETLTSVTCARVNLSVRGTNGVKADGWGETPLSVQWVWPGATPGGGGSALPYARRHEALKRFTIELARRWLSTRLTGHPMSLGHEFIVQELPAALHQWNSSHPGMLSTGEAAPSAVDEIPWLAALVCNSPFDLALHDAAGKLLSRPTYSLYSSGTMDRDLSAFLEPASGSGVSFTHRYPNEFLAATPASSVPAWHLVGGLDPLSPDELTGNEPHDSHPVLLQDWIVRDGLFCLKIKLRGNDADWDYRRMRDVGRIGLAHGVQHLSADFNCTARESQYVSDVMDRLAADEPEIFARLLYVEQPFPYDLEAHRIDVHSLAQRKPLFLDESAHDWKMIRLGRELGWNGVALKTCKTQTGAILSACWARAHGMQLMVQDLTNPMLAMIPHVSLAAHVGTIMGVETNSTQFYPAASEPEQQVHPGLYQRHHGRLDLSSIRGPGFGYRLDEIKRRLPDPAFDATRG